MERQRNGQTVPGERFAPSSSGGTGSAALAGLEQTAPAAGLFASPPPALDIQVGSDLPPTPTVSPPILSRAERAHYHLLWDERLARNARADTADRIILTLFGISERVATFLGVATA